MTGEGEKHGWLGLPISRGATGIEAVRDWRARISDNLAYGLLVYTGLQIFVAMKQLKTLSESLLPYIALIVLVAGIIPAARWLETHWKRLSDAQAHDPAQERRFRRDRAIIWAVAIGMPFLLAGLARLLHAMTS